jgi:hypothetical protein
MTDQQPVEPDAIIGVDGTALAHRDVGEEGALVLSKPVMSALVRMATAGPVRAATVLVLTSVGVAKAVRMAGRIAGRVALRDADRRPTVDQVEVTWMRLELRLLR